MKMQLNRKSLIVGLMGAWLCLPTWAVADQHDPTLPSPAIVQQLQLEVTPVETSPQVPPPPTPAVHSGCGVQLAVRLKAIVMRDADHATAMLVGPHGELYVLTLRRDELNSPPNRISLSGKCFELIDFSASALTLRCIDTGRRFTVN